MLCQHASDESGRPPPPSHPQLKSLQFGTLACQVMSYQKDYVGLYFTKNIESEAYGM